MESVFFRRVFPAFRLNPRKVTETEIETTRNGGRYTTSVGGTFTGRGADVIVVDDPIKAIEATSENIRDTCAEWFNSTLYTRRNLAKDCLVILTMQRLHEQDLSGRLINDGWASLVLPAIATEVTSYRLSRTELYTRQIGEILQPSRDTAQTLEETRRQVGSIDFAAQYQQDPVPQQGNIVRVETLRRYDDAPQRGPGVEIIITCDPASKPGEHNDYTAIVVSAIFERRLYVLECIRGHWTMSAILARIAELADFYRANAIIVEDTALGPGLIQGLRAQGRSVISVTPKGSKDQRLRSHLALFESGQVFLPQQRIWSADFERELLSFPSARYDDQVDAFILALELFSRRMAAAGQSPKAVGPIIVTSVRSDSEWGWR